MASEKVLSTLEKLRRAQNKNIRVTKTPGTTGAASSPLHTTSIRAIGRAFVDRIKQMGASGQKAVRKRLAFLHKTAKKFTGKDKRQVAASNKDTNTGKVLRGNFRNDKRQVAASKQFSTDFEGRVYSILSEKITHTMTPLETQKAKTKMERGQKFRQSHAQKAATKKSGFVQSGGADIGT